MKKLSWIYLLLILAVFNCSGCGKRNVPYEYKEERLYEFLSLVATEKPRADSFAQDLCVVREGEAAADGTVTAEAAATFSLNDNRVVVQKNPFEKMNPASITKVMTALVVLESGDLDQLVTVGEESIITESGASLCNIKPGDQLTMEQLLYGLMLPSGNDAGASIAVSMGGSIEGFSDCMNEMAHKLGATGSHFVNPHGLTDDAHYTTVYDLYLIFNEALKYPKFREIIHTQEYEATYKTEDGTMKTQVWKNSNQYLNGKREMPQGLTMVGGKTGTTKAAGYCLIVGSQDEQMNDYVSVVLKADSRDNLYGNMSNILSKIVN